jgi:hypothetical protein
MDKKQAIDILIEFANLQQSIGAQAIQKGSVKPSTAAAEKRAVYALYKHLTGEKLHIDDFDTYREKTA